MRTLSLFVVALIASAALLSSGCSEPGNAPAPAAPAAEGGGGDAGGSSSSSTAEGSEGLTSVSFNVEGMSWLAGCGGAIKKSIAKSLPGVDVEIPEIGLVKVEGDALDAEMIKTAIEAAGSGSAFVATTQ